VFALFEDEGAARAACEAVAGGCRFAALTRFLPTLPSPAG
jgi:hypothetical protein